MTTDSVTEVAYREKISAAFIHSMKATLLTIGDELLIGQVVNTNAAWLGEQLNGLGVVLTHAVTVGDDGDAIQEELARACASSDLVLLTGGLGPTHDDITREAVAGYFDVPMHLDAEVRAHIRARWIRRGRVMPQINERQALVPEGFVVLPNPVGTAPGLWRGGVEGGVVVVILPGVPHEMRHLFQEEVLPRLRGREKLRVIEHRTLLTAGIGESNLQEQIGDLSGYLDATLRLASLPGAGGVRLRLTATGDDHATIKTRLDRLEVHLRACIGPAFYGMGNESLEAVLGRMLNERGLTIAVAESCTGGLVLDRLTNIPGSSTYVVGGVVAYANEVKMSQLGVTAGALTQHGAVSEEVARQMARGVRDRLGADIGLSTTGVAGPSGGTPDKPVGTVWIGYADAQGDYARLNHFTKDRVRNKLRSANAALDLARRRLLEQ